MLRTFIDRFILHRHYWRSANLDEVSELYVSIMLRSMALGVIGVFVPFFLYQLGYGLQGVMLFYCAFFVTRSIADIVGGFFVARFGPKHTILASYAMQTITSLLFFGLERFPIPYLLLAVTWGISNSFFFVAFHVDFSKVKHAAHGGKEYGYISIVEKLGAGLGPLIGGIVAYVFSPSYIFLVAFLLLFFGLVPLFSTPEPVKTRQKLRFSDLPIRALKRDIVSYAASAGENNLRVVIWPLYLALFALGSDTYLKLGTLSSAGLFAAMAAAFVVGKLIDKSSGRVLLNISSYASALISLSRPFVQSLPFALSTNIIGEVATTGHQIPIHKGLYDKADHLPGNRIAYIVLLESLSSFAKLIIWLVLVFLALFVTIKTVMVTGFVIMAVLSILVTTQRFEAIE